MKIEKLKEVKTSILHTPNEDKKLSLELSIPFSLFKEVCSHASIRYWADFDKTDWKMDVLHIQEYDETTIYQLDYKTFCKGIAEMFKAEFEGRYRSRYYSIIKLLTAHDGDNYDACFADDLVQFCIFGKIVYC